MKNVVSWACAVLLLTLAGVAPVHAFADPLVPAVTTNATTRDVPFTAALICTLPAAEPSVTVVFAWPVASVVAVAGESVAEPLATVNVTVVPTTGLPELLITLTTRGDGSACPTSWTWPLPLTI